MFAPALVFIPLPVIQFGVALLACGILFTPIAALSCAWVARNRGLSIWRHALAGAAHSALAFLPWLYLISNMRNKPMSANAVGWGIRVAYVIWLGLLVSQGALLVAHFESSWPPWNSELNSLPVEVLWMTWWWLLVVEIMSASCFGVTMDFLKQRGTRHGHHSRLLYFAPFAGFSAHILLVLALVAYVYVPQVGLGPLLTGILDLLR